MLPLREWHSGVEGLPARLWAGALLPVNQLPSLAASASSEAVSPILKQLANQRRRLGSSAASNMGRVDVCWARRLAGRQR